MVTRQQWWCQNFAPSRQSKKRSKPSSGIPSWRKGLAGDNATCNTSSQAKRKHATPGTQVCPDPKRRWLCFKIQAHAPPPGIRSAIDALNAGTSRKNSASLSVFQTKPETVPIDPTHDVSVSIAMRSPSILVLMMSQFWSIWQQKGSKIVSFGFEKMTGTPS